MSMTDDTADAVDRGAGPGTVVLDLDGTLVDSVYCHVLAWQAAFADVGVSVSAADLHGAIGMGGDRLVGHVAGDAVERALGDEVRSRHPLHLDPLFQRIVPTDGAVALLEGLRRHQYVVTLASSSDRDLTERLLDCLEGAGRLLDDVATGDDADSSKPSGELVEKVLEGLHEPRAVVVGDTVWDVRAAGDAGVPCIGVLTGGRPAEELLAAGARAVYATPAELLEHLDGTGALLP